MLYCSEIALQYAALLHYVQFCYASLQRTLLSCDMQYFIYSIVCRTAGEYHAVLQYTSCTLLLYAVIQCYTGTRRLR